jgi:hypothetical protein
VDTVISPEEVAKLADILNQRCSNHPCARCGNAGFSIEGYSFMWLRGTQKDLHQFVPGGAMIPVVVTTCSKCGCIYEHALGSLGIMQPSEGI